MPSETYLDFCFIQKTTGTLASDVKSMFESVFNRERLHWYLDNKEEDGMEIVVAEVKGMSRWSCEEDVIDHLEENATEQFWETLQGYQLQVLPLKKGSGKCGNG
ncbi:hypothetical protein [Virgibacillus sp. DJP39]|uniref:hypothetical protein n=1 Tax=Virgibacillus sp. DJP39 TaxID=3409790 RepID=UPI003BB62004